MVQIGYWEENMEESNGRNYELHYCHTHGVKMSAGIRGFLRAEALSWCILVPRFSGTRRKSAMQSWGWCE